MIDQTFFSSLSLLGILFSNGDGVMKQQMFHKVKLKIMFIPFDSSDFLVDATNERAINDILWNSRRKLKVSKLDFAQQRRRFVFYETYEADCHFLHLVPQSRRILSDFLVPQFTVPVIFFLASSLLL